MAGENLNTWRNTPQHDGVEGERRRQLTADKVITHALVSLGAPLSEIEADPLTYQVWMDKTLDLYNKYMPTLRYGSFIPGAQQFSGTYNFDQLQLPYGRGVVDCKMVTREQFFSPVSGVFALGVPHPISHLAPDQYSLAIRYIRSAQSVYSSTFEWEWQEPVLYVHAPGFVAGPSELAYRYMAEATKPEDVPSEDHQWFKDYFLACLQESVGRVRRKFSSTPGPASMQLDGSEMVQEAREDKQRLESEIRDRSHALVVPLPPTT
jgi:hypothetical protein